MSGHSKWSKVKHQKGAVDVKRGQIFTKLSNAITITVKESGGNPDPESNFKLRLLIEKAKQANMPKINIDRAIDRGLGKIEGEKMEEIIYEGFGPHKVALLIQAVTDNRQRTSSHLKNILTGVGGALGGPGSVSYLFEQCGQIVVKKKDMLSADKYMEIALESNSKDFLVKETEVVFYTEVNNLNNVKKVLSQLDFEIIESAIVFKPVARLGLADSNIINQVDALVGLLEESDDVQKVFANL